MSWKIGDVAQWEISAETTFSGDLSGPMVSGRTAYIRIDSSLELTDQRVANIMRLVSAAPDMLAMLTELEWHDYGGVSNRCPVCGEQEIEGHDTCELDALLKRARGEA